LINLERRKTGKKQDMSNEQEAFSFEQAEEAAWQELEKLKEEAVAADSRMKEGVRKWSIAYQALQNHYRKTAKP
jgi:hypothetical protein